MQKTKITTLLIVFLASIALSGTMAAETDWYSIDSTTNSALTPTLLSGVLVAAPSASVSSGKYQIEKNVALSAAGSNSIRYTLDGTDPTCTTGTLYSGPIQIKTDKTLKAVSCYKADNSISSQVATYTYTFSANVLEKLSSDIVENESMEIDHSNSGEIKMGDSLDVLVESGSATSATIQKIEKLGSSFFSGATAVMSGKNLLNGYEIKINGTGLNITATMKYDPTGIDESTIKPYRFDGTSWVEITPFTKNTTNHTLTFTVPIAQTPYVLLGQPATQQSGGSGGSAGGGGGGGGGGGTPVVAQTSTTVKKGDATRDNKVDILDFNALMINWGKTGTNNADFDLNSKVDVLDFNILMVNWNK